MDRFYQEREEQARLEMKHRKEEDDLYRRFAKKREDEERRMANEINDEWERELQVSVFKADLIFNLDLFPVFFCSA